MKYIAALSVALCASLWFVLLRAEAQTADEPQTIAAREAKARAVVALAPQMENLIRVLAGEWSSAVIYDSSDSFPKGGSGHSRDSYRIGPGRLSLIQEYHGDGADEKSWGVGAIWWDAKVPGFRIVWCDSFALDAGCRLLSEPGKWEGDAFVATDVHEVSGRPVFEKEVWSDFTPNSFSQTLYVGDARDTLKRFMTIKAKRVTKP